MIELVNEIMWYSLIAATILFLISGIDDLFFDIAYWIRYLFRIYTTKDYKPLTYHDLAAKNEQKIAVLIPCWNESGVIGDMLKFNLEDIDYANFDVFVGTYPNDEATTNEVNKVAKKFHNIFVVISDKPGPTSKAQNLNSMYAHILEREKKLKIKYDIFILHDVEDIVHPLSFKLYNYLLPQKDMVQLPIYPLRLEHKYWTHWTYSDEFAELHTKDMIIREAIFGFVPSAGVGTALSDKALQLLVGKNHANPFSDTSLVEDYDLAYRLNIADAKQIFLVQFMDRVRRVPNWWGFGKPKPRVVKEPIATLALFPKNYASAVKQKGRWTTGIALQEWKDMGWQGQLATKLMLFHDRKALLSNFITGFGYLIVFYWIGVFFYYFLIDRNITTLGYYLEESPWVWSLIIVVTLFMLERISQRATATYRIYGLGPAIMSVPRVIYSNIINFHAILRAYMTFYGKKERKGKSIKWEKTENRFPALEQLKNQRRQLGDILLQEKIIQPSDLKSALIEQEKTGERLGAILQRKKGVTDTQILEALAKEYHLSIVDVKESKIVPKSNLSMLTSDDYQWMLDNNLFPIDLDENKLTVAINDPGNQKLKHQLQNKLNNYEILYVLYRKIEEPVERII